MSLTSAAGSSADATLRIIAQSDGSLPLQAELTIAERAVADRLFSVTTTADSGPGSLRQAILDSNADTGGTNAIDFRIPSQGVQTIVPSSPLPPLTNPVVVDGFSQPGYAGTPLIELRGSAAGTADGLTITGSDTTVRGLDIDSFSHGAGIHFTGAGATGGWVYGNFLGTDPSGTKAEPNDEGVETDGGATDNLIGTDGDGVNDRAERNVLSGNLFAGVWITGQGTSGNAVAGNFIGTDVFGTTAVYNGTQAILDSLGDYFGGGVVIAAGAASNRIGTDGKSVDDAGERNVIAGSYTDGIDIYGSGTDENVVAGNFIGTDATGRVSLGIAGDGVFLAEGASSNWIGVNPLGGAAFGDEGNVISGNRFDGMQIFNGSNDNVVAGNEIGTDATGTLSLPNPAGIDIEGGSSNNTFGGTTAGAGNLIADNSGPGVRISDTSVGDQITGDRIFGNAGLAIDLGNDGVTDNSTSPRQGPNDLQNFPVIVATAAGQIQGWLGGSTPDTTFRIDLFAIADSGPGGGGEAQDYLGSLMVTTDGQGQATFDVPFTTPAGLPIVTATATDPQGNTSEVSAPRQATFQSPVGSIRAVANQSLAFETTGGNGIAIQDPDAGPFNPDWSLTLSVSAGRLTLSSTAGLSGSGNGTASLSYSGPLSSLDAVLEGMMFNPPAGPHLFSTLALDAQSIGAPTLHGQFSITDGVLVVDTTADSGPGSLRQAILDADSVPGLTVTIEFAVPGPGLQTIEPITSLPAITVPAVIDGTTQPGFAGSPLIALGDQSPGSLATLVVSSESVTVRGLAFDRVAVVATTNERLIAVVAAEGSASRLSLLDPQGRVLVQNDGISSDNPVHVIDEDLTAGNYSLVLDGLGTHGASTWTTTLAPADAPFQPLSIGASTTSIVAADLNGDGQLDLAVTDSVGVQVLLGNGDGTFQPAKTVAAGIRGNLVAADFTGTGRLDLAVAFSGYNSATNSFVNEVDVLLGNGDGTFEPQVAYAAGGAPTAIAAGDFNRDGHIDLAFTALNSNDAGTVSVMLGKSDGTFQSPTTSAVGYAPRGIVVGDFNRDDRLDLAVLNQFVPGDYLLENGSVSVLLGEGDGSFQPQVVYASATTSPTSIVTGDFNGDGILDLAVDATDADGRPAGVNLLLGIGDGSFHPAKTVATGIVGALTAGDFTGDGHLDLVVTETDGFQLLVGDGHGTFEPANPVALGNIGVLVQGDFTGDGRLDLAASNGSEGVLVLLGNGDGTFQPQSETPNVVGSNPEAIVAGDFNGDGRLDAAVVDSGSDDISVLLGNGDGTFEPAVAFAVGSDVDAIVAADFNGDGRLDLALGIANDGANTVSVLLGNGDGTFQPQVTYAIASYPSAMVAGDFNRDGRIDLAMADGGVLLGNGDGTFQLGVQQPLRLGYTPTAIVAGDFTGDGRLDLAVAGNNVSDLFPSEIVALNVNVSVLLGDGDGTFTLVEEYTTGPFVGGGYNTESIAAGDFTGDGRLDLAVTDNGSEQYISPGNDAGGVKVLLGNGDGTFQPAATYAVGSAPTGIVAGDFAGDGHVDLAVAGYNFDTLTLTDLGEESVLLGNGDGTFQLSGEYSAAASTEGGQDFSVQNFAEAIATGDFDGDGRTDLAVVNAGSDTLSVLLGNGAGAFKDPGQFAATPHATPLVADVNGDGADDVLVVDGAGAIVYRRGIPGQPGTFEPPVTVNPPLPDGSNPFTSHDIVWLPNTDQGPVLASVDAKNNAISFYAYRDNVFVRLSGSLTTGALPAQIIAADLSGHGVTDLVVRNAGDGSLSVYAGTSKAKVGFIGPIDPLGAPTFLPAATLPVGLGVSDVQALDSTGSGTLDLVVTNKSSAQVSILRNRGDGTFTPLEPYRAGTGLSAIDPDTRPEVTSLDATKGLAAGTFTFGGPTDLVTINPGSKTMDVIAGLGDGRYSNPVAIQTTSPAQVVRVADFTGDGIDDLAVLTANGLSIYLGNGHGGFLPPTTYAVPPESDGLTVADLTGNGKFDLLAGDAFGDVLVLLGKGDGSFQPYHEANQSIELAVADLTGDGSKDIIYADQGLDRVVVDSGAGNASVLANQSTGLLDPGAVKLADLNDDGILDLIVANSGSNNVLIYPGLGNGQFGAAVNDGNGYFVGTKPVGITVASLTGKLPDLVVADEGSNQVSILLNQGEFHFSAGPRLSSGGAGPVSTVVGDFNGDDIPDILVTNKESNDVELLPGIGQGFFKDTSPTTFSVGAGPVTSVVGNFNGQPGLLTVNAGSNDLTLISGFDGPAPTTTTIASGGVDPETAFAFDSGAGFDDLVVGNAGDGELALFQGGPDGLSLLSDTSNPNLPDPTALAFSALTGGNVQFYAATAGRESAELVALSLSVGPSTVAPSPVPPESSPGAQLVALHESSLPLVATVLTLTISSSGEELSFELVETEATAVAAFLPGTAVSAGQGLSSERRGSPGGDDEPESAEPGMSVAGAAPAVIAPWQRLVIGLDEAIQQFHRENPNGVSGPPARDPAGDRPDSPPAAGIPAQGAPSSLKSGTNPLPNGGDRDAIQKMKLSTPVEVIDAVIHIMWAEDQATDSRARLSQTSARSHDVLASARPVITYSPRSLSLDEFVGERKSATRSELLLVSVDRGVREVLPVREQGMGEPALAATSLFVATVATHWGYACRWHRTERPGWPGRASRRRFRTKCGS